MGYFAHGGKFGKYQIVLSTETRPGNFFPNAKETKEANRLIIKSVVIGPEQALQLLQSTNTINRKVKPEAIAQYAEDMEKGNWHATHQGLSFGIDEDNNWVLIDGQNRLHAVVKAGRHVEFLTVMGFQDPSKSMNSLDNGRNRNYADAIQVMIRRGELTLPEGMQANQVAPIVRAIYGGQSKHDGRLPLVKVQAYAKAMLPAIEWLYGIFKGTNPKASISGVLGRAFYAYKSYEKLYPTRGEYLTRVEQFFDILSSNSVSCPDCDAKSEDTYAYLFRSWNDARFSSPEGKTTTERLKKSLGGSARAILYKAVEFALHNFLIRKASNEFTSYLRSKTARLRFDSLDTVALPEENQFEIPGSVHAAASKYVRENRTEDDEQIVHDTDDAA